MPLLNTKNKNGEDVIHYVPPFSVRNTDTITSTEIVRERRKEYGKQVEILNKMQKDFAAEKDYNSAKAMKDVIKHFTQAEKAATLVVDWYEKSTTTNTANWPVELYDLLDYEFNALS